MSLGDVYAIGTLAGGVMGLADLNTIISNTDSDGIYPNPTPFTPYTQIVGQDLNGADILAGLPICEWDWSFLFKDDIDALLDYVTNNQPTPVYIRTRTYDGSFANFAANMNVPLYDAPVNRQCKNVKVKFTALVVQS